MRGQVCDRVIRSVERDAADPNSANRDVAKLLINKVREAFR